MTPEEKQRNELRAVELLNSAQSLGLSALRNVDPDPPDVEGILAGKRVGIEVTSPIEEEEMRTDAIFERVILPRVAEQAAAAGPGQAAISLMNLSVRDRAEIDAVSVGLAKVCVTLAGFATAPGSNAASAVGMLRETLEEEGRHWSLFDVPLPLGIESVFYTRLESGPFKPFCFSNDRGSTFGAGLSVTQERIREKAAALPRWRDRFDERWLLIPVVWPSRTSVWQVKHDSQRFPNTGFDRIYLTDTFRPTELAAADLPVNAIRLDIHGE